VRAPLFLTSPGEHLCHKQSSVRCHRLLPPKGMFGSGRLLGAQSGTIQSGTPLIACGLWASARTIDNWPLADQNSKQTQVKSDRLTALLFFCGLSAMRASAVDCGHATACRMWDVGTRSWLWGLPLCFVICEL
jgi:hypothetical protein